MSDVKKLLGEAEEPPVTRRLVLEVTGPEEEVNDFFNDLLADQRLGDDFNLIQRFGYDTEGPDPWHLTAKIVDEA
jgi:hypothetical protein